MTENGKEQVGDYELLALIGDGAQGRVYKARYTGTSVGLFTQDEIVAVKLIRITGDDEKLRTKFQAQADILRRLSHTNIVRYRDSFGWHSGEWDEAQCLVMEFLEGETLADRLKKANAGLPWAQVEEVFEQCLAGLIHARERGITHRDLKPSNIFINRDGQAKVIDFDIARQDDSGQMSTAGWKGTFDYMAPDFITIPGFRGDEVSDVFSLGVCFYQALTGLLPFEPLGETAHIGYLNRWKDGSSPAPSFRPGVFRVLSNAKPFVSRCLAAKREHRYASFAAMLEDFRKIRARRIRHKNKDEYELLGVLGRGGFGEVFKARRISDGALVAVKHLFAEKQSERFIKEAKILQQYPHANLVKYVDFMIVEGMGGEKQYFLILEFLEGMPGWTLRTRLKNEGRLEAAEALPLYIGYLAALQFLHENSRPIIHRDIKPGNLYAPAGQPGKGKIFDLGVARDVSGTVTVGGVPGTLDYMPPEFAETGGDRGSPQSDIYALGLCLYESIAGRPVYERLPTDVNSAWIAFQQRLRKPVELSFEGEAFRQYPRLKGVVLKALAPRPVDRYRSAAEMKKELEHILAGTGYEDSHGDEEQAEMTVATLHSFSEENDLPPPEPGATLGTRPLEGVEKTLPAPVDLIAAGKAEAARRRRRKALVIGGSIAVGLLLAVGLALWLAGRVAGRKAEDTALALEQAGQQVEQAAGELKALLPTAAYVKALQEAYAKAVKAGENYPEIRDRVDEQRRAMRKLGAALPGEFRRAFEAALGAGKTEKAAELLKDWRESEKYADIMGLTGERAAAIREELEGSLLRVALEGELAALHKEIPDALQTAASLEKGEAVAVKLHALKGRSWPGFDESEKQKRVAALSTLLSDKMSTCVARWREAALAKYRAGQDGDPERESLRLLEAKAPTLIESVQSVYAEARSGVDAARQGRLALGAISRIMDRLTQARDAAGIQGAVAEYGALEKNAEVKLTPAQVKSVEEAVASKYLALARDQVRKIRGAYEADRIAEGQAEEKALITWVAGVQDRFGRNALVGLEREVESSRVAAGLRQEKAAAARKHDLEDVGRELAELRKRIEKGNLEACLNGVKTLAGSVAVAKSDAALKAVWGSAVEEYAKLIEATLLQRDPPEQRVRRIKAADEVLHAAAVEPVLAGHLKPLRDLLAKQKAKADEGNDPPQKMPAVADKPAVSGERTTPPAEVKPVVVSSGMGVLNISVAPRTADIRVDGIKVNAGSVEVSPNENHKITVESPGYKPFAQYYRVRSGDARKIEIFLEKEVKRSVFGW